MLTLHVWFELWDDVLYISHVFIVYSQEVLRVIPIHPLYKDMEGAILIFLPGLSHILELHDLIMSDRQFSNKSK